MNKISLNAAEKAFETSNIFDRTWTEYANLNRGMSKSEVEEAIRIIEDVFSQGIGDRFEQARRIRLAVEEAMGANGTQWGCASLTHGAYGISFYDHDKGFW